MNFFATVGAIVLLPFVVVCPIFASSSGKCAKTNRLCEAPDRGGQVLVRTWTKSGLMKKISGLGLDLDLAPAGLGLTRT